ncbi:MAG: hypothetical protein ORN58_06880, partial [Sediminibacterium sp.]|nr:hypothetical protein [Sediminibacterium sp.]
MFKLKMSNLTLLFITLWTNFAHSQVTKIDSSLEKKKDYGEIYINYGTVFFYNIVGLQDWIENTSFNIGIN